MIAGLWLGLVVAQAGPLTPGDGAPSLAVEHSASLAVEPGSSLTTDSPLLDRVRAACAEIDRTLGPDGRPLTPRPLTVERATSTADFAARSRRARYEAAAVVGRTLWIQPVLDHLGDVDAVLRHECVHAVLRARGVPPLDVIDEEAVALALSGQAARLPPAPPITPGERPAIARVLRDPPDRATFEHALARVAATYAAGLRAEAREGRLIARLRARLDLR